MEPKDSCLPVPHATAWVAATADRLKSSQEKKLALTIFERPGTQRRDDQPEQDQPQHYPDHEEDHEAGRPAVAGLLAQVVGASGGAASGGVSGVAAGASGGGGVAPPATRPDACEATGSSCCLIASTCASSPSRRVTVSFSAPSAASAVRSSSSFVPSAWACVVSALASSGMTFASVSASAWSPAMSTISAPSRSCIRQNCRST